MFQKLFCKKPRRVFHHLIPVQIVKAASIDSRYEQIYIEMRRHRNHELSTATWFSSILLAINWGLITFITSERGLTFLKTIPFCTITKLKHILATTMIIITFAATYNIWYSHSQYKNLRAYTNQLEPSPKYNYPSPGPSPHIFFIIVLITLLGLSLFIVSLIGMTPLSHWLR